MLKYGLPLLDSFPRRERKLADTIRNSAMEMFRLAIRLEKKYYNLRVRLNQIYRREREAAHMSDIEMIMKLCGICGEMLDIIQEQRIALAQHNALVMEERIKKVQADYRQVIGEDGG